MVLSFHTTQLLVLPQKQTNNKNPETKYSNNTTLNYKNKIKHHPKTRTNPPNCKQIKHTGKLWSLLYVGQLTEHETCAGVVDISSITGEFSVSQQA